jgi:acyl-CoA synthetase (AMP-forming)/AMP-acid ligase II
VPALGTRLQTSESGEVLVRSNTVLAGYWQNPDASGEALEGGWFHSGDLGHFDQTGMLWFEDRSKDVIKSGGENVASLEVERAIYEVDPRIKEVAVVGLPHDRWIEAVTALVITQPGADLAPGEIQAALTERLAAYKRPKAVVLVEDFPRTATGKIQKNVLRRDYARHYESGH